MPSYAYLALDAAGKSVKGRLDAPNLLELELHLKRDGLDLVKGKEKNKFSNRSKIKTSELINFFFNLDQLSHAGVPLLESLADTRDGLDNTALREIISSMLEAIGNGQTLSQAMALHPDSFDQVCVSLIVAGEKSGKLPDSFRQLTESLKWRDELLAKTRNMMLYPLFVLCILTASTFFLMLYLVPQLLAFISSMGQEIPIQTRILLATSVFFTHHWMILLTLPVLLFLAHQGALRVYPELRYHSDKLKLHIWPTGPVLQKIILARFARTFAMMYSSGISVLECLASLRGLVHNQVISRSLDNILREIEAGKNLAHSFELAGVFPPLVIRMLKVGEATGQLDHALLNVSYFYNREVDEAIKRAQAMIEPVMTVSLGALLGWVMLSVLSPIYGLIAHLKI